MELLPGAKIMRLNSDKLEQNGQMMSNTMLWITDGPPKTEKEAGQCLESLIWQMLKQYKKENGLEMTLALLERAHESCPELPFEEDEIPAGWQSWMACETDLKWGLKTAVEHPDWLEEVENPEDYDLYWLILETLP